MDGQSITHVLGCPTVCKVGKRIMESCGANFGANKKGFQRKNSETLVCFAPPVGLEPTTP